MAFLYQIDDGDYILALVPLELDAESFEAFMQMAHEAAQLVG
ncbi:MAG TPA: hypothetical protein VMX33_15095 [bacterium]|nr:hypothetical protein [bacterium]